MSNKSNRRQQRKKRKMESREYDNDDGHRPMSKKQKHKYGKSR